MMSQIAAVTGAGGHIGNCLVRELLKSGYKVRVLVHQFKNDYAYLPVEIVHGDLLDSLSLKKLCKDVDVVFHCAAVISIDNYHRKIVWETNVTGTKNMVDASLAAGIKKFIHFSSIDAFQMPETNEVLKEENSLTVKKSSIYNFSKAESEKVVLDGVSKGLDAVILSPTAVIGPYDIRKSFLGNALIKFYNNKIPALIPGGYNWVDVRDIVFAAIQSVEKGRKGEKYILSGHFCTIKRLSVLIGNLSGKKRPRFMVPAFLARIFCPFFQLEYLITRRKPMFTCQSLKLLIHAPGNISLEKSERELNYSPRPLEETLRDTFDWYKQNNYLI